MALKAIHYAIGVGVTVAVYLIATSMDSKASTSKTPDRKDVKVDEKAKDATITPPVVEKKTPAYTAPSATPKDTSGDYSSRPKSSYGGAYDMLSDGVSDSSDTSSWSDFGTTSTGRIETKNEVTHNGQYGKRNLILAKVNKNTVSGRKFGLV